LTKIRFIHNDAQAEAMTDNLIADIHSMAYLAGLFRKVASTNPRVTGKVAGFMANGTRALVKLDNREKAIVSQELTFPDVPLEWVITDGQLVEGYKDSRQGHFQLDVIPVTANQILTWYPHGTLTWALVQKVDRKRATLSIHPGLPLIMEKAELSSNPLDRVDLFLIVGDIVPVRVVRGPRGDVRLRMNDIDDDEVVQPSQPLIVGGLPWLTEERALWSSQEELIVTPIEDFLTSIGLGLGLGLGLANAADALDVVDVDHTSDAPAAPAVLTEPLTLAPMIVTPPRPHPGRTVAVTTSPIVIIDTALPVVEGPATGKKNVALAQSNLANAALKARIAILEAQQKKVSTAQALDLRESQRFAISELVTERDTARQQAELTRAQLKEAKVSLRRAQDLALTGPLYSANRTRFAQTPQGANDWVRHEITLAWIDRLGPEDRTRFGLPTSFTLGPKFAASFDELDNGQKNKALKAVVDVLTGYAAEIDARQVHPLREGEGAHAPDVTRGDGARCFRAYIEQKSPAARRLHYWQHRDTTIELCRVVTHDDMMP